MKAVLIDSQQNLVWSDVADPVPKDGEVVIAVRAAGVNRADLIQRAGNYPPPPGWPEWPGLECAGIIDSAPASSRWKAGDRVCALLGGGGYAEKVAVPEGMVMPMPRGLGFPEAAALPEAFATAYLNLFTEANLQPGETILVQAGASGLGIAAIQLAHAFGAKVVTTVGSQAKVAILKELGADIVVVRTEQDLASVMETNPVNVALDCIGGEALGTCLEKLAIGGRWILVSTLGGVTAQIALRAVLKRGLMLKGSTLRSRTNEVKAQILGGLVRDVWPKLESGAIKPLVHAQLPMPEAAAAMDILAARQNIGKVILTNP
ncbi:MAG: NAD(P)H-quinone oxidoreductase [Victivallales bacterium]|nr:NAD(P)H-quinone oxidoreductase [Victivallales bacterium]